MAKKIAVILAGCGHLDGSEVRESVLTILELDRLGANYDIFAPNRNQNDVINHITNEKVDETRNIMVESARIARGKVVDLKDLKIADYDAIILPGGFGVAKNLSDIGINGANGDVDEELKAIIKKFFIAKKPIGAICISPALVAKALEGKTPALTLGTHNELLSAFGSREIACGKADMIALDLENKIVSTPAYMHEAKLHVIHEGISKLVKEVIELC